MTGKADGTVYINSKLDTSGFKPGSKEIEAACRRAANSVKGMGDAARIALEKQVNAFVKQNQMYAQQEQKVENLKKKLNELKEQKIPTEAFSALEKEAEGLNAELDKVKAKQKEWIDMGFPESDAIQKTKKDYDEVAKKIDQVKQKQEGLVNSGKAYTAPDTSAINSKLIVETERLSQMNSSLGVSYDALKYKIEQYGGTISGLANRHGILRNAFSSVYDAVKKGAFIVGNATKKAFDSVGSALKKLDSLVNRFAKRIISAFSKIGKNATAAGNGFSGVGLSLKNILKYGFGIRSLYVLVNKLRSGLKEGFENLLTYSKSLENSVNGLKATALTLKNAFAAAFSPFVEIALPYVQRLLDYMVQLVSIAGQFFAALTGRKSYIRAIKQTTDALEDENAAMNKQLSGLDKLNNLSSQQGGKDSGAGGTMFEEVPIESGILDAAEKIKDILSKLFEPLKKAWEQEGQFVMDSWKYALEEVWKLIKDIGRDFMIVWNEDETVAVLANILHIIGDIGLIVGNLARNFREAWNTNQVGLEILRNIRDVIGIIVQHIRNMADATVEWADKLNFYPILDAFERFLDSIKPVVDAIWGIIEDFYTKVLLPLSKWTLEKGLPELLQVFIDFNNKVDWVALRANLAEFWEHLEPFAETVGEGLILFIQKVSDALAGFINSDAFKDFLKTVEDWMDSITAEDVANTLVKVAEALIALKLAMLGFAAIKGIAEIGTVLKSFFGMFTGFAGVLPNVISLIGGLGQSVVGLLGTISAPMAAIIAAVAALAAGMIYVLKTNDEVRQGLIDAIQNVWSALKNLWENVLVPLGSLIADVLKPIIDVVIGLLKELWQNVIVPLAEVVLSVLTQALNELADVINTVVVPVLNTVIEVLQFLWNNVFEPLIDFLVSTFTPAFDSVFSTIKALIEDLGEVLSGLIDFIVGVFTGDWKRAWEGIKQIFKGVWDGLKDVVIGALDAIKSAVESAFGWIADKISSIKEKISGIGGSIKGAIGGAIGYSISIPDLQVPVMPVPAIATANIPYLASGAVIPPNAPFLAVLGDQKRGTNIETPLSTLEDALQNVIDRNGGIGMGDITLHVTAEVEGYQLLNIMQKLDRQFFKQNGRHAFT